MKCEIMALTIGAVTLVASIPLALTDSISNMHTVESREFEHHSLQRRDPYYVPIGMESHVYYVSTAMKRGLFPTDSNRGHFVQHYRKN
ncbi:hypothetical protein BDV3_003388 [Batrachochytrium dendrobatidis]|nr:hypothetical protein O5D80_003936 [Batrachochytrium dendrobatidis]KAK5669217.1 hypothetical protein QVD99_003628 [Batrachochytrium dendrobatidis]